MLTLVEILIGIVVIVGVAAAICASPAAIILSPTSGDVVLAAKAAEMPLPGVLIFDGKWGPELPIITILVLCMLLTAILEFCRGFSVQWTGNGISRHG